MHPALSLFRREFTSYFLGPIGYVALVVVLLGTGLLFNFTFRLLTASGPIGIEFPMQGIVGNVGFWLIFWIIPPLITMRLFAEERATGTLEMLMTAPINDATVVMCKFLAGLAFYIVLWLPTLVYLPVLLDMHFTWPGWNLARMLLVGGGAATVTGLFLITFFIGATIRTVGALLLLGGLAAMVGGEAMLRFVEGVPLMKITTNIDMRPALTTYLGLFLAGGMFVSLGLCISSIVRSPIVAALVALAVSSMFLLGGFLVLGGFYTVPTDAGSTAYQLLSFFSVPLHFSQDFSRGIIDSRTIVLYVSVTLAALFFTVRSLEARRWQ